MPGIWTTGDIHGSDTIYKLRTKSLKKKWTFEGTQDENFMFINGDFGLVWEEIESKEEKYWLNWLEEKPFTTVFVDGNHENFDRLYSYPVEEWHGGKVHKIRPHVIHLMRGEIYDILGYKIFTFGGASSHDIQDGVLDPETDKEKIQRWLHPKPRNPEDWFKRFRIKHVSWWEQEIASQEERDYAIENLKKHGNEVDFIFSHCGPQEIVFQLGAHEPDVMTCFFNEIAHTVHFNHWYFGHYHTDMRIMGKFDCLYDKIMQIA